VPPPFDTTAPWKPRLAVARRASEIVAILIRFGFGEFVEKTGLIRLIGSRRARAAEQPAERGPLPVRIRLLLQELGSGFIKAGQILSTRPDLLPPEWIDELRKLQSDVPPVAWEGEDGIRAVLEEELGDALDEAFDWIDEQALAAASMAQVHRARLKSGEHVVVKVLRPGLREEVAADLELMRAFGRLTQGYFSNLGFDADAVVDEFSRQLARETDLTVEARSTKRMRRDFADDPDVGFPRVYDRVSSRSVLVLEEIEGTLLTRLDLATLTREKRERLARRGADMVFRQCLVLGFFHADPHPGNVFVLPGERLCFIDCGMTGVIDPATIQLLAQLVHGVIRRDLTAVTRSALLLADADTEFSDDRALRADIWALIDRFQGGSLESFHVGELLNEFFALLRKYRLRCPADIVYLVKALTTIEGSAEQIAPSFDLIAHVQPYVERLIRQRYGLRAMTARLTDSLQAYGDLFEDLPEQLAELFRAIRKKRISLQLEHRELDRLTSEVERASMNVSWSLVIASIVIGAAVLVLADSLDGEASSLTTIATWSIAAASLAGLVRLVSSYRSRR